MKQVEKLTAAQEKKELSKIGRSLYGSNWDRWSRAHRIWKVNCIHEFQKKHSYKPEVETNPFR